MKNIHKIRNFVLAVLCMVFLNSCYLLTQGLYLIKYTKSAVPIERIEKSPSTPDSLRRFLRLVGDVRAFAIDSLGLAKSDNYTTYVAIPKNYLIDVVYAAGRDNLILYQWHYPFFGGFPYQGYFLRRDAEKEAARLEKKGYDVYIGRVDAFSTLGILTDPVYSFMSSYSVYEIADLIIHEQTHATLYLKNQAQFDEELAVFMGTEGARAFIRSRWGDTSAQYRTALRQAADEAAYGRLMRSLYDRLKAVYDSPMSRAAKLAGKDSIIAGFKDSVDKNYDAIFRTPDYKGLSKARINNAFVAIDMTYGMDLGLFYNLYEQKNKDLKATMKAIMKIKKMKGDGKELLREMVGERKM